MRKDAKKPRRRVFLLFNARLLVSGTGQDRATPTVDNDDHRYSFPLQVPTAPPEETLLIP
jgi:hypothetical protein